jgi:hypothetical protein
MSLRHSTLETFEDSLIKGCGLVLHSLKGLLALMRLHIAFARVEVYHVKRTYSPSAGTCSSSRFHVLWFLR